MSTRPVTCRDIADHLCEQLDDGLDSAACRRIRKHLADCPDCTALLDSLKKTVRLYTLYPTPKLPARCRKRLVEALAAQRPSRRRR
jgi:predicted anti-sigma-YlaC factor YlaD